MNLSSGCEEQPHNGGHGPPYETDRAKIYGVPLVPDGFTGMRANNCCAPE